MSFEFDVIHTLEARSSFHLDFCKTELGFDSTALHNEINLCYQQLRTQLATKGIDYMELRTALVPLPKKIETAFFFDWTKFNSAFYGNEVMDLLLPLLDRTGTRSVLYGDWINRHLSFAEVFAESYGDKNLGATSPTAWRTESVTFFYVNNLTKAGVQRFKDAFSKHRAYIGALDLTYTSLMKAMISTMLIRPFIQHKNVVIQSHEDGEDPSLNKGQLPWNFAKAGLTVRTVDNSLYDLLLSYKIERPVSVGETDVLMSLNALTPTPVHIDDCLVDLDRRKFEYLCSSHGPALKFAGLAEMDASTLAQKIKQKLRGGYIYSMQRSKQDSTLKFTVVIESPGKSRIQCGLKYFPSQSRLSVVTVL